MTAYIGANAFVIAGGVSSRMGVEKGLLELGGVPVVVRTARLVEPLVSRVAVIGPVEKYGETGFRVVPDRDFGIADESGRSKGPLVGIATALANSDAPWNLVLACDLPYLTREWIEWLLARAAQCSAEVVVPKTAHGLEPLAAVYRKECLPAIERSLAAGVRKVTDALSNLVLDVILHSEWAPLDPSGNVLENMNTPVDYQKARKWWDSRTNR